MAIPGQILTQRSIDRSRSMLAEAGDQFLAAKQQRLAGHVAPLHDAVLEATQFPLRELSDEQFRRIAALLGRPFLWVDDRECIPRALLGAAMVQQALTGAMLAPADDAFTAAFVLAKLDPVDEYAWPKHAATLLRRAGDPQPWVVDPLLFAGPVRLSRWSAALEAVGPVQAMSPFRFLDGLGFSALEPAKHLDVTWARHRAGDLVSDHLVLPRSGHGTVREHRAAAAARLERELELEGAGSGA